MADSRVSEKSELLRQSTDLAPHHPPKPYSSIVKTCVLLILATVHIGCNIAVIFATIHTYRFGAHITKGTWVVSDNNLIAVISICAKALQTIMALLGGWAVSHLWTRRLSGPHSTAGLAELQSLTMFQSISSVFKAIRHLLFNHYLSAQWVYAMLIFCALLLQLYSTAMIALATPSIAFVSRPPELYHYLPSPFMAAPGYGRRCDAATFASDSMRSCLEIMLAGRVMTSVEEFDGTDTWSWNGTNNLWVEADTNYVTMGTSLGVAFQVGPLNNVDLSAGAVFHGINIATVERLINVSDNSRSDTVWNSVEFEIDVETTVPLLTCQCARQELGTGNTSSIKIQGDTYQLGTPIPLLQDDELVGQVTTDNMTLIISVRTHGEQSLTHCATNLKFRTANLTILGTFADDLTIIPSANVFPTANPWDLGDLTNFSRTELQPMQSFSDYWLGGLGWSSTPDHSALASFLGGLPIGTGSVANNGVSGNTFLEYYILVMLSSGISTGFSPELDTTIQSAGTDSRTFQVRKREYYLGAITPVRYFYIAIIVVDSFFVFFCVVTILFHGWCPDWTDPLTLMRTALCSAPPLDVAGSAVAVFAGEDTDKRLWEEKYSIKEVGSGEKKYMVFTHASSAAVGSA